MKTLYESILDDEDILVDKTKKDAGSIFNYMRMNDHMLQSKRCYNELNNKYIDWLCECMPCLKKYKNLEIKVIDASYTQDIISVTNGQSQLVNIYNKKLDKEFQVNFFIYVNHKTDVLKFMKEFEFEQNSNYKNRFTKKYQ